MESILIPLLTIIAIDLVLAGDNAVVIALATRNLPIEQRKKAIFWGAGGAVIVRVTLTFIAVQLLNIPYLMAAGGLLLVYVAVKLLIEEEADENLATANNLYQAVKTIVVADIVMGLDNVLAVAGASHGSFWLILFGLAVSIPLIIWGSQVISNAMNKYPILVYIGSAIIAYTAAKMFLHDNEMNAFIPDAWNLPIEIVVVVGVILIGKFVKSSRLKTA
ncbi:TerC family protein [Chungangia koreensis]|uniref:TerC family protein n=1 Tax=Chungangia koreensis TaxID=752657 RepID=A0ABV8X1N9_9LACT